MERMWDLMVPKASRARVADDKEPPPLPLAYDRVREGHQLTSNARLTRLPPELLTQILLYIPRRCLASLALVNQDCRQLARSRQFSEIVFDYTNTSIEILYLLNREHRERLERSGSTKSPSLGACIRRITISADHEAFARRHGIGFDDDWLELDKAVKDRMLASAGQHFFDEYMPAIYRLLRHQQNLPHLDHLDVIDPIGLTPSLLNIISSSTIQYINIHRADCVGDVPEENHLPKLSERFALRNVMLGMGSFPDTATESQTIRQCIRLLTICAPYVEALTWNCLGETTVHAGKWRSPPHYPSLRRLRLSHITIKEISCLWELVHDGLEALELDLISCSVNTNFLAYRNCVKALDTLVLKSASNQVSWWTFLSANPQIKKLNIIGSVSRSKISQTLLPQLRHSFHKLESLKLAWDGDEVPEAALESISKIRSLQQLCLSAGRQSGWRHNWQIDHVIIRKSLSRLPLLKKLAFTRDSYVHAKSTSLDLYYAAGRHEWSALPRSQQDIFERMHRTRMVRVAEKYAKQMALLEWLFVGQLPIAMEGLRRGRNGKRKRDETVRGGHLVRIQDDHVTCLEEMFGWKGLGIVQD